MWPLATARNFPALFAATVRRFPDRLAVSVRGEERVDRFTYRVLDAMVRAAAGRIRERGLGPGDRVAILAENSAHWCAAYLGILQAGAIAVPFDTNYHVDQVETLLHDCGAKLLLASERYRETATAAGRNTGVPAARLLDFVEAGPVARDQRPETEDAPCPLLPSDTAVILYTSGTTADPKGVVLTHANLLGEKDGAFAVINVDERDAVLGVLPLFHSLAQMANLLLPFSLGAHVVFLQTLNPSELMRALDEEGISVFACVPQFFYLIHKRVLGEVDKGGALTRVMFRMLLAVNRGLRTAGMNAGPVVFARVHRRLGRRMRFLITGGSRFDPAIGRDLHDLGFTIMQAYGLTETSGAATVTRHGDPIASVGRPFPGVDVRIEQGEVLLRGPIVMKGYWNRPDATAEVLRDGWLHTGDLGEIDSAGRLTVTGRRKEMIVLGSGKNIYPEEIEAHYRQSPFIKELCVLGVPAAGVPAGERLHAIVVPDLDVLRAKKIVNISELVRFELEGLSVSLPSHKRVLGFDVVMDPLSRTTTGKLKRHEILRQYEDRHNPASPRNAGSELPSVGSERCIEGADPAEPHVRRVVAAVQQHLGPSASVRPESNFELDLGLDSMERVELLASLERSFGVRVPEDVAQAAFTVRALAEAFRDVDRMPDAPERMPWASLLSTVIATPQLEAILVSRPVAARLLSIVATIVVRLLTRPRVEGLSNLPARGPYIVSPNHQSYVDPFVLAGLIPRHILQQMFIVGAAEYFETPLTRRLSRMFNVLPVDPDAYLLPAMQGAAFGLAHGRILMLFPEGERSIDGTVRKFKKGAAILSTHAKVPIVPVAIHGVFEIWPRNRPLAWRRLLPWSGHRVNVRIGTPIMPVAGDSYDDQTVRLRAAVERMWLDANGRLH